MSGHTIHPRMLARADGYLKRRLQRFETARKTTLESLDNILNALHGLCATPGYDFASAFIREFEAERQKLMALDPFQATDQNMASKIAGRLDILSDALNTRARNGNTTSTTSR